MSEKCPLTNITIDLKVSNDPSYYYYETEKTGKVNFTDVALPAASELSQEEKYILSGICRNRKINKEAPIMITAVMLKNLKDQQIPYSFEDRQQHFLSYLYENGGKEFAAFTISTDKDSPITYSSPDEFERILKSIRAKGLIEFGERVPTDSSIFYSELHLTEKGIKQVELGSKKNPMIGLISQKIEVGEKEIDQQLEHARTLFIGENSTLESKRSACESLCFILEPLRKELNVIIRGDTEVFFQLVNKFAIRHNNESTKRIEHEEQLEWVFYALLNTINTYYKMKNKLS